MASRKPVHSLILDTGPLIKNEVAISTLLQTAEQLFTIPAVISEIRDAATRSRVETTLLPFLTIRNPTPASYEFVAQFSKKTGDFPVLSRPDLQVLALAYEIECERLGGNWRLRSTPGQKRLNGKPPAKENKAAKQVDGEAKQAVNGEKSEESPREASSTAATEATEPSENKTVTSSLSPQPQTEESAHNTGVKSSATSNGVDVTTTNESHSLEAKLSELHVSPSENQTSPTEVADADEDDSDGEWITPSNIKKVQAKDSGLTATVSTESKQMAVATMTTDFAMQNVLLQMNLNLLSIKMQRIKHLQSTILRCHACFFTTKDMEKQFCPRCGQPTLNRVGCSTSANGEFKVHLNKNSQYNTRGDRFSIPKPVAGSANGRVVGGGKGGWGNELILTEDQKEYTKAIVEGKRIKTRDLMDEDYLPGILTGDRGRAGGRPKVGAGKNVNARKRH
jgi:RNA-binding protein NOB1